MHAAKHDWRWMVAYQRCLFEGRDVALLGWAQRQMILFR